jgi:2-dehydropantoate 2-reductase
MMRTSDRSAERKLRIAVFGVGGVGGYFGAQLVKAGEDVAFIARGRHLDAIRDKGLCVTSPSCEMLVRPALVTADPGEVGIVDAVILGVKAEQVGESAASIRPMLGSDTFVVPLKNGVEAAAQLSAVLGVEHVVGGLCGILSWVSAPGHIRTLGDVSFIRFGELENQPSERTQALRRILAAAGIKAEIPVDIHKALWEKFLLVSSLGGMGAARAKPFGQIREDAESRRMLELAMREVFVLGRARGVALADNLVERTMAYVDTLPDEGTASLQRDIADGKPSELDAWNGAVVRLGRDSGVEVPVHTFIYETLLPAEQKARANCM